MAACGECGQEMLDDSAISCPSNRSVEYPDGITLPSRPYAPEDPEPGQRCHDCNVAVGGQHHAGCDMEMCPRCGGQLISCGCLDDEDDDGLDVEYDEYEEDDDDDEGDDSDEDIRRYP